MAFEIRLDSLELENFHKFEHYTIGFDEHMTVLVGNNGSGKSSILDAACVALGTFLVGVSSASQRRITSSDARIGLFDMGDFVDRQGQYPVTISACGRAGEGARAGEVKWSRSLNSAKGKATIKDAMGLLDLSRECFERLKEGDADLVLPVISYYGTGRLWAQGKGHGDRRPAPLSRQDGYKGALDASVSFDQVLDWFYRMTVEDLQREQGIKPMGRSPLFAAVRGAVERCFQALTGSKRVNVTYSLSSNDLVVEYLGAAGEVHRMPLGLLSDGYRTTLSMIADIAYRMALLNPALGEKVLDETPGVVLIDGVDLHLHPLWQARILRDLREIFPKVQFIVTTHAPVVISSVSARHIRLLGDGAEARMPDGEIYGSDVGRVLISVMGAPERPVEVQGRFDEFYRVLDERDFPQARAILDELEALIGDEDTDLVGARIALSLEEADARYAAD